MKKHVIGFSGSLRKESFNQSVLEYMVEKNYDEIDFEAVSLKNIPLFNGDVEEGGDPEAVEAFKTKIKEADGLLIIAPEYSQSIPGVLKNALDWAGSMAHRNVLDQKPVLLAGASPTQTGTGFSQAHLRQVLAACNAYPMQQPQIFINQAPRKIVNGEITDEKTKAVLDKAVSSFSLWIDKING